MLEHASRHVDKHHRTYTRANRTIRVARQKEKEKKRTKQNHTKHANEFLHLSDTHPSLDVRRRKVRVVVFIILILWQRSENRRRAYESTEIEKWNSIA